MNWRKRFGMKKGWLSLFLLAVLSLSACAGNGTTESNTGDIIPAEFAGKTNPLGPEAASIGGDLFQTNCAACHGPQGHGDGPAGASLSPAPRNLPELSATVTDDYLFWRISTGKDGTAMVAWKGVLSDEQIWQLVAFIRTLK